MFDISPDHAIGIYAGLVALATLLVTLRIRTARRSVPGTILGASVLIGVSGAIHLGLITTHLQEPVTAALFMVTGTAALALSQAYTWRWWRLVSALLVVTTLLGYLVFIAIGFDSPDQVAVATKLMELTALGLVLIPVRGEQGARRAVRWTALGIAIPLLTLVTTATVWVVDLARPDAQHVHPGAILQATNADPTPEQVAAAAQLYAATEAAIAPYRDWHAAWSAGYRPGGPQNMPSTHWMNQRYVDAGYVLDTNHPQGLVYANTKRGPVLLGAMFQMKHLGQFGPDPGGPLTAWHEHQNICFTPFGFAFSFMTPLATCPLGAIDISAPAMLHVWIVDNPQGGRFAVDIDSQVVKRIDQS